MTKRHRPQVSRPSQLATTELAAVRGGSITHVEMKRGQVESAAFHDQGIKVYVDVVY